jgi:hypothetical protein
MRTNYKDIKKRYELADIYLYSLLPSWKKSIINECRLTKQYDNDRIFDEFIQSIITTAEDFSKDIGFKKGTKTISITEKSTVDKNKKSVNV